MQEAFGPYTSHDLQEQDRPMDLQDTIVVAASVITTIAVLVLIVWGVL